MNMAIRDKMINDIFIALTKNNTRDNKNHYCETHKRIRAMIIEKSLYLKCCELDKENLQKLYSELDISKLIHKIEEKTTKCIYNG